MNETASHLILMVLTTVAWMSLGPGVLLGKMRLYTWWISRGNRAMSDVEHTALNRLWALILGGGHLVFQVLVFVAFVVIVCRLGYQQLASEPSAPDLPEYRHWFDTLRRLGLSVLALVIMIPLHGFIVFLSYGVAKAILTDAE